MSKHIKTRPPTANIPPFGLRMQPELKERVEQLAKSSGRSMNAQILHMIESYLEDMDREEAEHRSRQEYEEHLKSTPPGELDPLERLQKDLFEAQTILFKRLAAKHGIELKQIPGDES